MMGARRLKIDASYLPWWFGSEQNRTYTRSKEDGCPAVAATPTGGARLLFQNVGVFPIARYARGASFVAAAGVSLRPPGARSNCGVYTGRILKGEQPQQSTKVEMFLNLRTAKALGTIFTSANRWFIQADQDGPLLKRVRKPMLNERRLYDSCRG